MNTKEKFLSQFAFSRAMNGYIGIERERFLKNAEGLYMPHAEKFLSEIKDPHWTHELSACQVEDRTDPQSNLLELKYDLIHNTNNGVYAAEKNSAKIITEEVAARDMPLDVFPLERYKNIVRNITEDRLRAACRVAGTHIHIGVGSVDEAIRVHNVCAAHTSELIHIGDHSSGARIALYKEMAGQWKSPQYENAEHFFETATVENFSDDPKHCYHLVRISIHGTVECRMFGVTPHEDEIIYWVEFLKQITGGVR